VKYLKKNEQLKREVPCLPLDNRIFNVGCVRLPLSCASHSSWVDRIAVNSKSLVYTIILKGIFMSYKKFCEFEHIVLTDGFWFSGSGLVNDMFGSSGFTTPKHIRLEEFLSLNKQFSWPDAICGRYTLFPRFKLFQSLVFKIISRVPINLLQLTFIYRSYLKRRGRTNKLHEPTSINRSLWSLLVNLYYTVFVSTFNEVTFFIWLDLKFRFFNAPQCKLLLDNGIPRNHQLIKWLFKYENITGFYVYRDPRLQFAQITEYCRLTGKQAPGYLEFLNTLLGQYHQVMDCLKIERRILMISCDNILDNAKYRKRLENYLRSKKILNSFEYDFEYSIKNNLALKQLVRDLTFDTESLAKEREVINYHKLFEKHFKEGTVIGSS
jgi:hypothetical protein